MQKLRSVLVGSLLGVMMTFGWASAATPAPPPSLCIQGSSGTSCASTQTSPSSSTLIKWHPGHYIRLNDPSFAALAGNRQAWFDRVKSQPLIQGALVTVPWGSVETSQGVYDFSQIDHDLAYLKAMGKRLIIEVWWMNYWNTLPSAPQSGGVYWLPDYMISNGCAAPASYSSGVGYTVQLHLQPCMDRLIALFQALGQHYNSDPNVEQIIITEPSVPYATYDSNAFLAQFQRLVAAMPAAWPNTSRAFYMNWFDQPGTMAASAAASGVGLGGPDVLPPPPVGPWEDDGSQALRGAGGKYGTVDYRGKIPVSYSFEALYSLAPSALIGYVLNTLKVTHMAWGANDDLASNLNWDTGVIPTITAINGQVGSTACPTVYNNQCSTQ